jgi:hypothetical protein
MKLILVSAYQADQAKQQRGKKDKTYFICDLLMMIFFFSKVTYHIGLFFVFLVMIN